MTANIIVSALLIMFTAFMCVWKMRFAPKGEFFKNYLSVGETNSIKGMCAVFVFLSHLCMYFADDFTAFFLFKHVGAIMVGGFFFVSGYGLEYSMMNKQGYLKGFFKKRFLPLLLTYYVINAFYISASKMDTVTIIKSLFGYNENLWFVMAIGIFYIGFYICNRLLDIKKAAAAMSVFVVLYMAVMRLMGFGSWWYNTGFAFTLGIWWSLYNKQITAFFRRKYFLKLAVLVVVFAASYDHYTIFMNDNGISNVCVAVLNTTLFPAMLAVIAMKIQIGNPILSVFGQLSFEVYLTHALLIHWLRNGSIHTMTGTLFDNQLMYLAGVVAGTLIFSMLVHIVCRALISPIKRNTAKTIEKRG